MKDWKCNTVKVGDTIQIVRVKEMFVGKQKLFVGYDTKEGSYGEMVEYDIPDTPKWIVDQEIEITKPSLSFTLSTNGKPDKMPINLIDEMSRPTPWQIVCIKGVSDNRDDYMTKLFEVK